MQPLAVRLVRIGISFSLIAPLLAGGPTALSALAGTKGPTPMINVDTVLQTSWMSILNSNTSLTGASVSAYAFDLTSHQVLGSIHPNWRQPPASVTKLITSAAALENLGPNFRYVTRVTVPTVNPPKSTANGAGPIYLVGGGDPLLEANKTSTLEALAAKVASRVKEASRVVGVSTLYAPPIYGIGWTLGDSVADYGAGTSALMAERSEIEVAVSGAPPGTPPVTELIFNSAAGVPSYFHVVNHAVSVPRGEPNTLAVVRELGTNNIVLTGHMPQGAYTEQFLSIGSPALYAATLFQSLLERDGVKFQEAATTGALPSKTSTIASYSSEPLKKSLILQNQFSVNQMAENLYRMLGVPAQDRSLAGIANSAQGGGISGETSGSIGASAKVMSAFLAKAGVNPDGLRPVDGSGLSELDEMSSSQVVQVLRYASTRPWFPTYLHSLMQLNSPNAGFLVGHPYALPQGSVAYVKTGNLSNQWNYAGYIKTANGHLIAFAILDDGPPTVRMDLVGSALDQMLDDVAKYPGTGTAGKAEVSDAAIIAAAQNPPPVPSLPASLSFLSPKLKSVLDADGIVGVSVTDASTGKVVWNLHGNTLLNLGLLPRLAVADAALDGAKSFGNVTVQSVGDVQNGTLNGPLVLTGNEYPDLTTANVQSLANQVAAEHIRRINGPIEYVYAGGWLPYPQDIALEDIGQAFAPPEAPLTGSASLVTLHVTAGPHGTAVNASPTVTVSPADAPIRVVNQVTVDAQAPTAVNVSFDLRRRAYVLTGSVQPGGGQSLQVAPPNAPEVSATVFRDALRQAGVSVQNEVRQISSIGQAEPGVNNGSSTKRVVARIYGPSISSVVPDMLNSASSQLAGQLYRALGNGGFRTVLHKLGSNAFLSDPLALGWENYATPNNVASLLVQASHDSRAASLASALKARLWNTVAPQVHSIAGFVRSPSGRLYAVVAIASEMPWNGNFAPQVVQ